MDGILEVAQTPLPHGGAFVFVPGNRLKIRPMKTPQRTYAYEAPSLYLILFYSILSAWTLAAIFYLGSKLEHFATADLPHWLIMAFIVGITWYFSLGISYKIEAEEDGSVRLTSYRRVLQIRAADISVVQGPFLPIGFVRFRLQREKAYLFCVATNHALHEVLSLLSSKNPDIKFKSG
jgi:hypothetical protein